MEAERDMCKVIDVDMNDRPWTVLVQVLERHRPTVSHPQRSPRGRRYCRVVVTDDMGTKVSVLMYETDIRYFANLLLPYKRYYITAAGVSRVFGSFSVGDYPYIWTLRNTVLVEEHDDEIIPRIPCGFGFTRFTDFYKFADTDLEHNVRAVVIHAFVPRQISHKYIIRDFVIVDEEKVPMVLTIWSNLETDDAEELSVAARNSPIIVGLKFKVSTFYSLSLTSTGGSYVMINPPITDEQELRDWYIANQEELQNLVNSNAYEDGERLLPKPAPHFTISVRTALSSLPDMKTAWVMGKIEFNQGTQKNWYTACRKCHKGLNVTEGWEITCPSCKTRGRVVLRSRIAVVLKDDTARLNATLFSPDAEAVIPFTPADLKEADKNGENLNGQLSSAINGKKIVCFLKYFDKDNQGQMLRRYTIIKAYFEEDVEAHAANLQPNDVVQDDDDAVQVISAVQDDAVVVQVDVDSQKHQVADLAAAVHKEKDKNLDSQSSENQFFTPSTKLVLESMSQESNILTQTTPQNSRTKRSLAFGDIATSSTSTGATAVTSPTKKNKE